MIEFFIIKIEVKLVGKISHKSRLRTWGQKDTINVNV